MTPLAVALASAPSPLWYASRGSGVVSLILLTLAMLLGTLTTVRWSSPSWPRFLSQDLHRNVSLLVLVFLGLHILTSVLDPFARLRLVDAVVPFAAAYRPIWLGLGVIATELLLALVVTSVGRHRIGPRAWSAVHWAAYACWPLAVLHGLGTGTDTRAGWSLLITGGCILAVVAAGGWRLRNGWPRDGGVRLTAAIGAAGALVAGTVWTAAGPLSPGWARRAGTPTDLLAGAVASAPANLAVPTVLQPGLSLTLRGTLSDDGATTTVRLSDGASPATSVTLQASDQGSSASLAITRGQARVCSTTATVSRQIDAVCGTVAVSISLRSAGGSAVSGQLSTGGGP